MCAAMDVQPWSYAEPSRITDVAARLAVLRCWIDNLSGVPVAKDDDAAKTERDRIAAEAAAKSQALFESLKKAVEDAKLGKR